MTVLKLLDILNMALSVYDAVIGSYENSGGSFAEAWAISEHQGEKEGDEGKLK